MNTLLRITGFAWRHRLLFISAAALGVISIFPRMIIPRLLGSAIDEALTTGLQSRLFLVAGAVMLVGVLKGVLGYGASYLIEAASQQVAYDLRKAFFHKLQGLSFGFYDRQKTGDLMSRATVDVEAARMYVAFGLLHGMSSITFLVLAVAMMVSMHWRLAMISLAFLPILIWASVALVWRLHPLFSRAHEETGKMNALVQEDLAGMRVVKAFGAGDYEKSKFERRASAVTAYFYAAGKMFVTRQSVLTFIFAATTAAVLWYGGREVFAGRLTVGELSAFILYMGMLALPVGMWGWRIQVFSRAAAAGKRFFEVLDADSPVQERPHAKVLPPVRGRVRFERVSLSYDSTDSALRDVDFEVEPGQTVAVLGGPGSGKSTVVHLIPRFYEVSSGAVYIDGIDVHDVTLHSLRQNIGIVLQDVFAFSATIRDNIAYGVDGASLEDVVRASKIAQLHEFVADLPEGYDTWVGERGITLSGGQRQRLAIARTILLDPAILILDDSTSSVDVGTEHLIQRAMAEVIEGRTTFVIAHRLSTVRNADLVLVLDHGQIVERGTHRELLKAGGFYRRIHDLQLRPQEEDLVLRSELTTGGGG